MHPCARITAMQVARELIHHHKQRQPARGLDRPCVEPTFDSCKPCIRKAMPDGLVKRCTDSEPVQDMKKIDPEIENIPR
jgi:hypothetical protein